MADGTVSDPTEMTAAERAKVAAAVVRTVEMVHPDGHVVQVQTIRVDERLAAGYQMNTEA